MKRNSKFRKRFQSVRGLNGSVMDYFEIFMGRMLLCRKAAEALHLQFKLMINEQQLI